MQFMWDWMHVYVGDGIFNKEINAGLVELGKHREHRLGIGSFDAYLQLWQWPRAYAGILARIERSRTHPHSAHGCAYGIFLLICTDVLF